MFKDIIAKYLKKPLVGGPKGTIVGNAIDMAAKTKKRSMKRGLAPNSEEGPTSTYTPRRGGNN